MPMCRPFMRPGSRLTHDVKNLLQTLRSLCAAAETSDESDSEALRLLMQRQLPQITQRLQITLDKLNTKPPIGQDKSRGKDWWQELQQRFAHERVEFDGYVLARRTARCLPTCLNRSPRIFCRTRSKNESWKLTFAS